MASFRYLTAEQWGRTLKHAMQTEVLHDRETYIHHTAGNPFSTLDGAEAFRRINVMEQNRGYACIGYDILVHHNTKTDVVSIGEGRGPWRSAATLDRNEEGEAIVALGYFHPNHSLSAQPSPAMLEGIARGIVWGMDQGWIARNSVIRGHRDNPAHPSATACPGNYLYAHLPGIRGRVAQLLEGPTPTPTPTPPPGPEFLGEGSTMKTLVLRYGGSPTGGWSGYYSIDGGRSRLAVKSMHQAALLVALGAVDAKTAKDVTDPKWGDVTHTTKLGELDAWLTPGHS